MLLPMVASINANAHDFEAVNAEGKTIYYVYNNGSTGTTVSVSYRGSDPRSYSNEYSGDIVISESVTYNGVVYSVTSIGDAAISLATKKVQSSYQKTSVRACSNCSLL